MDMNMLIAVIGSIGGIEGIKWSVRAWVNRKTDARKEDASADALEIQNLLNVINSLTAQLDKSDGRMTGRDAKVDFLYGEVRKLEEKVLELIKEKHELELRLKEAEMKKCDVRGCANRVPPSDY